MERSAQSSAHKKSESNSSRYDRSDFLRLKRGCFRFLRCHRKFDDPMGAKVAVLLERGWPKWSASLPYLAEHLLSRNDRSQHALVHNPTAHL